LSLVARELAFPAILIPCFIVLAILLAVVFRKGCPDLPRRYRDILTSIWFLGLVVVGAAAGIYYLRNQMVESRVSIEVDMQIDRGTIVELFVNDLSREPYRDTAILGHRHIYSYDKLPHDINLLRFDPTEQNDTHIVIYSITVKSGSRAFKTFGPAELKNWTRLNLSTPVEEGGGLVMSSVTDDPILSVTPGLRLPGAVVAKLGTFVDDSDGFYVLAIAAFLLVLLARASSRAGRLQALQISIVCCIGFPIVFLMSKLDLSPPPVTATVGYASYNGYAKANDILSGLLIMLLSIGLGYGCARWVGRNPGEPEEPEAGVPSKWRNILIAHVALLVLIPLYFLPPLRKTLQSLSHLSYHNDTWDAANSLLWGSLVNRGLHPYLDFWYPYGGFYLQMQHFPVGHMWTVIHCTVVLWFFYLGLLKVTGHRLRDALTIYGMVMAPLLLGTLNQWHRYLMPIDVVLFYAAICNVPRLEWKTHLPFAALAGYVCFSEPPQIVCAACAILLHTGLSMLDRFQGQSWREGVAGSWQVLKQRVVCVGLPMLAGIVASTSVYASNGMLAGIWDFEKSVADVGDYSAVPAEMARWVLPALERDTVFLLLFLIASYTAYRWVRMKGQSDPLGTALIVLCAAGFVAMQKQIVRPHIMSQWRIYPYVALSVLGVILWRERKPVARIAIAVFLGCLAGGAYYQGLWAHVVENDFTKVPEKVSDALAVALHDDKEIGQVNDSLYERSRFVGFDAQTAVLDNLKGASGLRSDDSVYVLGDDLIFYILLKQAPPYHSNFYNTSPIYEQEKVLDWFHRKNPRFIIWGTGGPGAESFDLVPNVVRLPLIYDYIVENYGLSHEVGQYRILTRRAANEPPDLKFWRQALGERIDLGGVPRRARLSEYGSCEGDKALCDAVLVVRYPGPEPVSPGKLNVKVESAAGPFQIQWDVAPGQREYVVNLNRIWFWNVLAKSRTPEIFIQDEHAKAFLGYHRERGRVLY